jgi:predicted  nucleic acid-binding Zn-ribbon protein
MSEAMGNLPDNVKFPAVFNALKIQGLTKASLLSSAQEYIKIIDNDAIQFNAAIDQKVVTGIESSKKEIENLRGGIQSKTDMITALQNEIVNDQSRIQQLSESIQGEESKLSIKISSYKNANENKRGAISQDIEKINILIS